MTRKNYDTDCLKVVHVLLSPRIGGAESLVSSMTKHWAGSNIQSMTLYLDESTEAPRSRIFRMLHLYNGLRRVKPNVILAHSAIPSIYTRVVAPFGTPVIPVLHSASDDFSSVRMRLIEKLLGSRTAHIVAVSQSQVNLYSSYFGSRRNISVIPNGIRSDIHTKSSASRRLESLVTISRVAQQKNPALWIDVAERLAEKDGTPSMSWWGPLSREGSVQKSVSDSRSTTSAGRFMGPTSDPSSCLTAADALFHPADREAHSIGILEAAAAGLPVVCSASVAATLSSEIVAVVYETGNAASAVDAINDLTKNWDQLSEQAILLAAGVRKKYSIENCAAEYEQLMRSAANK